jgi:prepilin-type N-terminal cleavage/methylation domain-containing protein
MPQAKGDMKRSAKMRLIGFTLAEILVALALIALLAAVLLPTVAGQILKGDASRVAQDLDGVRAGISQFLADVHRYPGKYSDLSKAISITDTDINAAAYTSGLTKSWGGPYVTKDTTSAVLPTGFGATVHNVFVKMPNTNGVQYVNVRIFGMALNDYIKVEQMIDGPFTDTTLAKNSGLLRFTPGTAGIDTVRYLAVPIQ